MKKLFIFLFVLTAIYTSCSKQTEKNVLLSIDSLIIEKKVIFPYNEINPVYYQIKGDSAIILSLPHQENIKIYNLENRNVDTIFFVRNDYGFYLSNFHYINNDSIWIYGDFEDYNEPKNSQRNILALVDKNANIKLKIQLMKFIDFCGAPCGTPFEMIYVVNKKSEFTGLLAFVIQDFKSFEKEGYTNCPVRLAGLFDVYKQKFITNDSIKYPEPKISFSDNKVLLYPYIYELKPKEFIIGFQYTPSFYIWNTKYNVVKINKLIPKYLDSENDGSGITYGNFYKLNDSLLMRIIGLSDEYDRRRYYYYVLCDTNFNYLGEGFQTKKQPYFIEFPDKYNCLYSSDSTIEIIKAKPHLKYQTIDNLKKVIQTLLCDKNIKETEICKIIGRKNKNEKINNFHIQKYMKDILGINKDNFALIIFNSLGCTSCNDYLLNFININSSVFFKKSENHLFVLLVDNEGNPRKIVNKYQNLITQYSSNIYFDSSETYSYIHPFNDYNPRLILVENGQIVHDTIYMPDNLEKCALKIIEFKSK